MASLQTHRKLLPASNSTNPTVQTCLYFCNSQTQTQNNNSSPYSGFCPEVCLAICPSQCHYSLSLPPNNNSPHHHHHNNNISPLLICMLVVLASVFLLIILYILYTKLYHHFYYTPQTRTRLGNGNHHPVDEDHGNRVVFHPYWYISTASLPPTEIRSIPTLKYENNQMETQDCGVCLTEFEQGDELRVLPKCNHAFHLTCIDTWLSSHTTCPLCRTPIIPLPHHHHHHHHHKAEDTSSSLASVEGVTEDNSPAAAAYDDDDEVLSISAIRVVDDDDQEVVNNLEEASTNEMMFNQNKSRFMD